MLQFVVLQLAASFTGKLIHSWQEGSHSNPAYNTNSWQLWGWQRQFPDIETFTPLPSLISLIFYGVHEHFLWINKWYLSWKLQLYYGMLNEHSVMALTSGVCVPFSSLHCLCFKTRRRTPVLPINLNNFQVSGSSFLSEQWCMPVTKLVPVFNSIWTQSDRSGRWIHDGRQPYSFPDLPLRFVCQHLAGILSCQQVIQSQAYPWGLSAGI